MTALAGAFTVLFAWYNQPWVAAGYVTPFSARVFGLLGVAFAAWTLAAFAIGVLAGMLIRRVVPAIVAALAAYTALAFATGLSLRGHYLTPLVTSSPNPPGSAWITANGTPKAARTRSAIWPPVTAPSGALPSRRGRGRQAVHPSSPDAVLRGRSATSGSASPGTATRNGPPINRPAASGSSSGSRARWLLALSALLISMTVWLVHRRVAWRGRSIREPRQPRPVTRAGWSWSSG